MVREQLASCPNRLLSHPLLLIPLGTPSLKNTLLLASHTLPTNSTTNIRTGDIKRDTFLLSLLYACYDNKPFFVVLFKRSFVIHLCCQIICSVREINHFPKHWTYFSQAYSLSVKYSFVQDLNSVHRVHFLHWLAFYTPIFNEKGKINIIKHCQMSILYLSGKIKDKKNKWYVWNYTEQFFWVRNLQVCRLVYIVEDCIHFQ